MEGVPSFPEGSQRAAWDGMLGSEGILRIPCSVAGDQNVYKKNWPEGFNPPASIS